MLIVAEGTSRNPDTQQFAFAPTIFNIDASSMATSINGFVGANINPVLEEYLKAWGSPVIDQSLSFELEDTDLLPTFDDFLLVFNYYTDNGKSVSTSDSFDVQSFLVGFYQKPAVLRLAHCCVALGRFSFDSTEAQLTRLRYFKRAYKALHVADLTPSVDILMAFENLSYVARVLGDENLKEYFFYRALKMLVELKMDIDPDDLPLDHLTPRQKEERRRLYWQSYRLYSYVTAYSSDYKQVNLQRGKVKVYSQAYDPYEVFEVNGKSGGLVKKLEGDIFVIIGEIRRLYCRPPSSIQEVFNWGRADSASRKSLASLGELIPVEFLLLFDDATYVTLDDEERFISQTSTVGGALYMINMNFHSCISVCYRPIMFLTALPSCRPMYLSSEQQNTVVAAIKNCYEASWRITSLLIFFEKMQYGGGKSRLPENEHDFYNIFQNTLSYLEAYVSLWFIVCRMDPQWLTLAFSEDVNTLALQNRLRRVLEIQEWIGSEGRLEPIHKGMMVMLEEIEEVARAGKHVNKQSDDDGLESIILGIHSLALGVKSTAMTNPWCYLGLLGLEIGSERKVKWMGRYEEAWRLFWKLNA
ncbi:hypothetical protein HDU79_008789 [Rhizoclosmatium sp. JEL0117]|nr:hypothetical protein HDU79_008789 [Rhizoclosmatium sp. JEL0117]